MSSYTFPFLESGQFAQASCDLFGSFVQKQIQFASAASKAVSGIAAVQELLVKDVAAASITLDSCVFTLMPAFSLFILTVGGCLFATDTQRARLAAFGKFLHNTWDRFVHRNRVYDVGTEDKHGSDTDIRLGVQGNSRCELFVYSAFQFSQIFSRLTDKSWERLFEKSATIYICIFFVLLGINAIILHVVAVPSIILAGHVFDDFELSMEFLADQTSPHLFMADVYTYTALGIFGLQCNASTPFFGLTTPEIFVNFVLKEFDIFDATHEKWALASSQLGGIKSGLDALRESGRPVESTFRDLIAPLVLSRNYSAALRLAQTTLFVQLGEHESIAAETSNKCRRLHDNTLSLASFGRDTSLWFIYGISAMLFGAVAFISSLLIRDASLYKLELSDVAADPSSVLHNIIPKLLEVHEKQQSVMSQRSMLMAFGLVIGIQILGIALPIRYMGGLAQQSPIANQVGRLDVIMVRGAYLARDLVINDELSNIFMVRCNVLPTTKPG